MAKKILLASGCSYTDTHYRSNDPTIKRDWEMWPELMAKELGLECVNKGQSGAGADHIFDTILEGLSTYGDRVDTVAILWSTSDRLPFFNFTLNPIVECNTINGNYDPFPWMDDIGVGKISQKYFKSDHFLSTKAYKSMILNPIRKMFAMTACICFGKACFVLTTSSTISRNLVGCAVSKNTQCALVFFSKYALQPK